MQTTTNSTVRVHRTASRRTTKTNKICFFLVFRFCSLLEHVEKLTFVKFEPSGLISFRHIATRLFSKFAQIRPHFFPQVPPEGFKIQNSKTAHFKPHTVRLTAEHNKYRVSEIKILTLLFTPISRTQIRSHGGD
jgi:hypothetical protein